MQRTPVSVPRDHSWSLLRDLDHIDEDDVREALDLRRRFPSLPSQEELDARFVAMTDHPYWLTDNGDLASVLDGEAEEQREGEPFGYAPGLRS